MTKGKTVWLTGIIGIYLITLYSSTVPDFLPIFKNDNSSSSSSSSVRQFARASLVFEENLPSHYPWERDINCSKYAVRFGKDLKKTYLVSYPRSGNTWLRYLIEGATGVFTSSIYSNEGLYKLGFLGELGFHDDGKTIVTKTHGIGTHASSTKDIAINKLAPEAPVILLIRDPSKSILSYWNFLGGLKKKKVSFFTSVENSTYKTGKFHKYVSMSLKKWILLNTEILNTSEHIQILFYEDVRTNIKKELLRILDFLQVPVDEGRLQCLLRHSEGPFKREHAEGFNPYSKTEENQMKLAMKKVLRLAKKRGFEPSSKELKILVDAKNRS